MRDFLANTYDKQLNTVEDVLTFCRIRYLRFWAVLPFRDTTFILFYPFIVVLFILFGQFFHSVTLPLVKVEKRKEAEGGKES